jgi:hypothetical protein
MIREPGISSTRQAQPTIVSITDIEDLVFREFLRRRFPDERVLDHVSRAAFPLRATSGTRTLDPSFTKAVLYRLS